MKWMKRLFFFSALCWILHLYPNSSRSYLETAQTYKASQEYAKAIETYKLVIQQGGSEEEIWFATLMVGTCYEEDNQWHHALFWYLNAYQLRSDRPVPLCKIATHYRSIGQNNLAHLFAQYGLRIPQQEYKYIFEFPPLRDYQFEEELSIAAYYTRFRDDGYEAVSNLMIRKDVPWFVKSQAGKNLLFYIQNLKNARFHPITIDLPLIHAGSVERYFPMNPSILPTEDGYLMIVRTVNYTQTGSKFYHTYDPGGVYRTKNFLVALDFQFNILSQREIVEDLQRERCPVRWWIEGLEDCRLFSWNGSLYCTCTTTDSNPTGRTQISLCHLDVSDDNFVRVDRLTSLLGPDPNRDEKNWLPFIHNGQLQLVYSCHPLTFYEPNLSTGECTTVFSNPSNYDFSEFRGSAPPIAFDGGHLMLIHEVIIHSDATRCYTHRFVYLDANRDITRVSKPFVFQHQGVEFCCSMCLAHQGKELIMAVGTEDRCAALCIVDVETIRSSLGPLPTLGVN